MEKRGMAFRFGLIGAGGAASLHVPAMRMQPGIEVVAIADVDRSRAEELAARYAIPEVYEGTEALLASASVDALAVLSPHHMHLPAVQLAAERGVHVLVEKALAPTAADADRMVEICRRHKVALGGILQYRFTPGARSLRQAVQGGSLGRIFLASVTAKFRRSAEYYSAAPWRGRKAEAGGGALTTQAIHTLDLLIYAMGMPRRVCARTTTVAHRIEVEDLAVGLLEYDQDCVAVLQTATAAVPENPPQVEIHGVRGTAATFDNQGEVLFWASTLDEPGSLPERWRTQASAYQGQESGSYNQAVLAPHAENIADFVAAAQEGRTPQVDGVEASKVLRVIGALYASGASGTWVDL
jgi:UDP-N-acetyl-2-amino-2-deoxyglucuronate dehydrogenase